MVRATIHIQIGVSGWNLSQKSTKVNVTRGKYELHHFISDRYQYFPSRYELHSRVRVGDL